MPEPGPAPPDKSYIQSLTLKGAAAMALAFVAGKLGLDPADPALRGLSDSLVDLVFYAGLLGVGVGRARARAAFLKSGETLMQKLIRALALAFALVAIPACATLKLDNPVAAAKTVDQQAYALISTYAVTLEQATELVRDPATPAGGKQALARAEAVATPAVETLKIAVVAYLKADAAMHATPSTAPTAPSVSRRSSASRPPGCRRRSRPRRRPSRRCNPL